MIPGNSSPRTLHWRINCFCNRRCSFCYGPEGKHELPLDEAMPAVERFIEYGIETFVLTGGEPLLSKKVDNLIEFLSLRGRKVVIYTNCDLFDYHEDVIREYVDTICVPIDGASEYVHDSVRGKNNFRAVLSVLNRYAVPNSPVKVKVGTVMGRNNAHELRAILYLLDKYKIDVWKIYEFLRYEDRSLQKQWSDMQLGISNAEYRVLVQELVSVQKRKTKISLSSEYDRGNSYFMMNPDLDILVPMRNASGVFEDVIVCNGLDETPDEIERLWREKIDWESYENNLSASNF